MLTTKINFGVAAALVSSPWWVTTLQPAMAIAASAVGFLVGALTLIKIIRDWNKPKP